MPVAASRNDIQQAREALTFIKATAGLPVHTVGICAVAEEHE
jgi:hypothetical protein